MPLFFISRKMLNHMKENQLSGRESLGNSALIEAHECTYRAMADVNHALNILAKHAERGSEPGAYAPGRYSRIVGELREMLSGIQQMIGRAMLRNFKGQYDNEQQDACHE